MTTRDEIPHEQRLADPITVTVLEVRTNPKPRRAAEIRVTDENGAEMLVVIWETHAVDQSWEEGRRYTLRGVRGKRYSNGTNVELHTTKAFSARKVSAGEATRVLVLGDTHVGYRHRPSAEKPAWAKTVNARTTFVRCLDRARELDVSAVVHVGDVFDHVNTREDRIVVRQAISRTVEAGVPFHYVFGNHDDAAGRLLLQSSSGMHLAERTSPVGELSVNLLGVDHAGQSFPAEAPPASMDNSRGKNVLVIHESPHPVVDATGALLYQDDSNKADLSGFVGSADFEIDFIVCGHLHVANHVQVQGYDIPVLVTGPTIPISTIERNSNPAMWLLTATQTGISVERHPV